MLLQLKRNLDIEQSLDETTVIHVLLSELFMCTICMPCMPGRTALMCKLCANKTDLTTLRCC